MPDIKNTKWMPALMALTIIAIAVFQLYWLRKAYEREERTLEMRSNILFRETVFELQSARLKLDKIAGDSSVTKVVIQKEVPQTGAPTASQKVINMVDIIAKRVHDSAAAMVIRGGDTMRIANKNITGRRNRLLQFLFDVDSLQDSVRITELEQAYAKKMDKQGFAVPFIIRRMPTIEREEPVFNQVTLGFYRPVTYELTLGNKTPFLLKRISIPILFSFFLIAFAIVSFSLLYRNLLRERRLADIKNEFISNITHELKTPIATVSVAIEALRSFNDTMDSKRTKEYLDISASELQRLSLLVDKVLKLSMFEKKEIELRYELLDMKELIEEVTTSMRLQFEKKQVVVTTAAEGDTMVEGDRLHLVSVVFNLLDNALKYSADKSEISIRIKTDGNKLQIMVADSGIGIPAEYHHKIFEKFFRVPTGNLHNAKGYGLGLSYVAHVIEKHDGIIHVESVEGKGSKFLIVLPKHKANSIQQAPYQKCKESQLIQDPL